MSTLLLNYRQTKRMLICLLTIFVRHCYAGTFVNSGFHTALCLINQNLCQLINLFCITNRGHAHECNTHVCIPDMAQMYQLD